MCGFSQFKSYDRNVIHDVCGCHQASFGNKYYDYTVGSQVVHDNVNNVWLSNGTFGINRVNKSTSLAGKYAKNIYVDSKYSHVTVIDNYRRIQTADVGLVQCSHRNTSTKVPVNNTNLGVGFVCNTNNTNTCCEEVKNNCVGDGYENFYAARADGGLEHHNVGCNYVLGLYEVDFLYCNNVELPSDCYLVYIHPTKNGKIFGFHYFTIAGGTGRLTYCSKPPIGVLSVWYRTQMYGSLFNDTNNGWIHWIRLTLSTFIALPYLPGPKTGISVVSS